MSGLERTTDQSPQWRSDVVEEGLQSLRWGPWCLIIYFETVDLAISKPSFSSSPTDAGAPDSALLRAISS